MCTDTKLITQLFFLWRNSYYISFFNCKSNHSMYVILIVIIICSCRNGKETMSHCGHGG